MKILESGAKGMVSLRALWVHKYNFTTETTKTTEREILPFVVLVVSVVKNNADNSKNINLTSSLTHQILKVSLPLLGAFYGADFGK